MILYCSSLQTQIAQEPQMLQSPHSTVVSGYKLKWLQFMQPRPIGIAILAIFDRICICSAGWVRTMRWWLVPASLALSSTPTTKTSARKIRWKPPVQPALERYIKFSSSQNLSLTLLEIFIENFISCFTANLFCLLDNSSQVP